jgi:hypothetical protein
MLVSSDTFLLLGLLNSYTKNNSDRIEVLQNALFHAYADPNEIINVKLYNLFINSLKTHHRFEIMGANFK